MTSATITEIAAALNISGRAVRKWRDKFNWQPINKTGVDAFDINVVSGLESYKRTKIQQYLLKKLLRCTDYQLQIDEIQDQQRELKNEIKKLNKQIRRIRAKMRGVK